MNLLLPYATIAVCVAGVLWALRCANDTLHPLLLLMPAAAYIYGFQPLQADPSILADHLTAAELNYANKLNFFGVCALVLGTVFGSRSIRRDVRCVDLHAYLQTPTWRGRLRLMALILGGGALFLYAYGLVNVGGFVEAYDSPKGGGRASSGYLRDFSLLSIPAILLLYLGNGSINSWGQRLGLALLSTPLLVHGLLSARRGPTFMGITVLVVGWYLTRNRRPSLTTLASGGATVGLLLLALVTFRGEIYIGSSLFLSPPSVSNVVEKTLESRSRTSMGNEFSYGSYIVAEAKREGDHYWGTRYLTYAFIRPIPRFLWPTKYEDVGMESLLVNAGTLGTSVDPAVASGEKDVPLGAAPGFIGDLYVEFSWVALVAIFLIGWGFAFFWRRSVTRGGVWLIIHACSLVLSLYLVSQTVEAILFRFLVILVPTFSLWQYMAYHHAPWARAEVGPRDVRVAASAGS